MILAGDIYGLVGAALGVLGSAVVLVAVIIGMIAALRSRRRADIASPEAALARLERLRSNGLITEQEHEAKRAQILSRL